MLFEHSFATSAQRWRNIKVMSNLLTKVFENEERSRTVLAKIGVCAAGFAMLAGLLSQWVLL